jgi:RNA polymerase sigma-70 factor (ECF subfamily)
MITIETKQNRGPSRPSMISVAVPHAPEYADEFRETALPHLDAIYRFACRLARNSNVAEDLVQETFLQAWRSFHRFDRGTNCRAWLFGILYFVRSHERRRRGREPVVFDDTIVDAIPDSSDSAIPDRITDDEVLAALKKLPNAWQETVLLTDVEGFTYREASAFLEIPLGTVMSRLNRARRRLRVELADYALTRGIGCGSAHEARRSRVLPMRKMER